MIPFQNTVLIIAFDTTDSNDKVKKLIDERGPHSNAIVIILLSWYLKTRAPMFSFDDVFVIFGAVFVKSKI